MMTPRVNPRCCDFCTDPSVGTVGEWAYCRQHKKAAEEQAEEDRQDVYATLDRRIREANKRRGEV